MKRQEQGKTEQARKDLGETLPLSFIWFVLYLDLVLWRVSDSNYFIHVDAPPKKKFLLKVITCCYVICAKPRLVKIQLLTCTISML
jgi:hypothetical protein